MRSTPRQVESPPKAPPAQTDSPRPTPTKPQATRSIARAVTAIAGARGRTSSAPAPDAESARTDRTESAAPQRAETFRGLQRTVGNARVSRLTIVARQGDKDAKKDKQKEKDPKQTAAAVATAAPDVVPAGGTPVNKIGIVDQDRDPQLKLRSSPSSDGTENIAAELPFNTRVHVLKSFPGDWYYVSTASGLVGYAWNKHIRTNLPEPNAILHRVEAGRPGYAISIAERHYKEWADDWGQDLRFYVNVIAWANHEPVPDTTSGWKQVRFQADRFLWIPSHRFARSLIGVVNSGSISWNVADRLGVASALDRLGELWDDAGTAISLSEKYMPDAIARHVEKALWGVLKSLWHMLLIAGAVLLVFTVLGGAIAGPPGAAAGFELGLLILEWFGLAMLILWIKDALIETGQAFGRFLKSVWNARGEKEVLDKAAWQFADAVGVMLGHLVEAIAFWAISMGVTKGLGALSNTRFGRAFGETQAAQWLRERVENVKARQEGTADPNQPRPGILETGSKPGRPPTAETIREGSVRMEDHPAYESTLAEAKRLGFDVRTTTGAPRIVVREVINTKGELLRTEKELHVQQGMRFLDLEHEMGHIQQLTERFGDRPPPSDRVVERAGGKTAPAKNLTGIIKDWQNTTIEYHNRLVEFLRLKARSASPELLSEHASGVQAWREAYWDARRSLSKSATDLKWIQDHFPDLSSLETQYAEAGGKAMEPQ